MPAGKNRSAPRLDTDAPIASTLIEAAAFLGVTAASLRQQIARGSLKAEKRGRDWFVEAREVSRYASENRRKSA